MLFVTSCVTTFRDLQTSQIEIFDGPCGTFYLPSLYLHLPKLAKTTNLCPLPYKWITNLVSKNEYLYQQISVPLFVVTDLYSTRYTKLRKGLHFALPPSVSHEIYWFFNLCSLLKNQNFVSARFSCLHSRRWRQLVDCQT